MTPTPPVEIQRCARCGYLAIHTSTMNQHRRRARLCADAGIDTVSVAVPFAAVVDPVAPRRPGPKPRDYETYFAGRASVWDVSRRRLDADMVRSMDPTTANLTALPAKIFRALWGVGAPEELQSILAGPAEYVYMFDGLEGPEVVHDARRRTFRLRMARFILETFEDDIADALGNDEIVQEFVAELTDTGLSTVGDMILTRLALECSVLAPVTVVPKKYA